MPDMEHDDFLQDVIHQLMTLPADVEEDDESFRQQFNDIRFKYPNQWVAYTEVWDESAKQSRLIVQGPFASMNDALAWTKTLTDEQRDRYAIFYAALLPVNTFSC